MSSRLAEFAFRDSWVTPAAPERVREVLLDLEHYVDWWPQVRAVASLGADDALVVCRSALPFDLELHLHAVRREPDRLEVDLDGPIRGFARWHLTDAGAGDRAGTRLDFEQQVHAVDRALVWASRVARPLLAWNHDRMMRGAQGGLDRLFAVRPAEER